MFKKKNKNLHRALIALMVLGLLVCLCFTVSRTTLLPADGWRRAGRLRTRAER